MQNEIFSGGLHKLEGQSNIFCQCHGVLPSELDRKLSHLLIEQQKNQIEELESELHSAQSKLHEKEAELQALRDCVKLLTEIEIFPSTVSGKFFLPPSTKGCMFMSYNILGRKEQLNYWCLHELGLPYANKKSCHVKCLSLNLSIVSQMMKL